MAIGTFAIAGSDERPAMRAHAALIHGQPILYCLVRTSLLQFENRMPKSERELRQDIVDIGRLVYQKGWVAANDGNITVRLDDNRILATPTGISKGMMQPDDLIIVD